MAQNGDGWGNPRVRSLRTASVVLFLGLLAYVVLLAPGTFSDRLPTLGTLMGALIVSLGYRVKE